MKKYIREMIDDLKTQKAATPKSSAEASVKELMPPPQKALPDDLSNQDLSKNPEERVKQLDYQAFESERLQTDS